MIRYPLWLDPSKKILCNAMRLALQLSTRIIKHTPMQDCANAGYLSPERAKAMAKNAAKMREARRMQQLAIPETYDDQLGR